MPVNYFRPKPGRFGVAPLTATHAAGTDPLTANQTTSFYIPLPRRAGRIAGLYALQTTLASDADGTVLCTFYKVSGAAGATSTALCAATSLETTTAVALVMQNFAVTATESERRFIAGNCIRVDVVSNSAGIDVQPVNLRFVVEYELEG